VNIYMWPGDDQLTESIDGLLNGVARDVDLETKQVVSDMNGTINMPMTLTYMKYEGQETELIGKEVPVYQCIIRIIDVLQQEKQEVTLDVHYTDGTDEVVVADLQDLIKDIGDQTDPTKVEFDLFVKNRASTTGTIVNWHEVNGGDIIIR